MLTHYHLTWLPPRGGRGLSLVISAKSSVHIQFQTSRSSLRSALLHTTQRPSGRAAMVSVQDDALHNVPLEEEEDGIEFRMLMVYAQRTLPNSRFQDLMSRTPMKKDGAISNGEGNAGGAKPTAPPKKEKKKRRRWKFTPQCLRPPKEKEKMKCSSPENREEAKVRGLVQRLRNIIQNLEKKDKDGLALRGLRRQPSVQHDGDGEENLIEEIVAILRREGDKLNKEIVQEQSFFQRVQPCWSYSFFRRLTETYANQMVPDTDPEEVQQSSKIALCVHATTQLTALDNHPMNRMFGFGARYLKENYSQWIKEHGGWEKVLGIPDTQEEESE
ncbi:apoptosis facilitator Bcl-2-like protein 14 [Dendropsophus ebraccatus]|uniref:apoptosis facilitator Bcl-2-like protein 14 n=1 Tax=Dendropsophus ebraccatus TaxID=150705 RepID=UPI003831B8B5